MIVARPPRRLFTAEEYLTLERRSTQKSEYLHGEIYAMAGASPQHNIITANVISELRLRLKGKPCITYASDMKVRTTPEGLYAYPDVTVGCETPRYHDEKGDILTNPTVIVEVLSPTTETYDRHDKRAQYEQIESLTDILLIAQDRVCVELYSRQADNGWQLNSVTEMKANISLDSLSISLPLAEIYDRVTFPLLLQTETGCEQ